MKLSLLQDTGISGIQVATVISADLEDSTHVVNTDIGKVQGAMLYNTTTDNPVYATGNGDTDVWVDGVGDTVHTPIAPSSDIELIATTYTVDSVAGGGTMTCNVPGGTLDGHHMLMHVIVEDDVALLSTPSGWTHISNLSLGNTSGDDLRHQVFYRIASSEPASYEVPTNHALNTRRLNVSISTWDNVHADIFDVTPTTSHREKATNTVNPSCPAITSVTDGARMVCFAGFGTTPMTGFGAQSGYTLHDSDLTLNVSGEISSKVVGTAGLETPGAWTNTSGGTPETIYSSVMLKRV